MIGEGVERRVFGMPLHNPKPSTERGKRRHAARNESQQNHAQSAWNKERSTRKSRYQVELETKIRPTTRKPKHAER